MTKCRMISLLRPSGFGAFDSIPLQDVVGLVNPSRSHVEKGFRPNRHWGIRKMGEPKKKELGRKKRERRIIKICWLEKCVTHGCCRDFSSHQVSVYIPLAPIASLTSPLLHCLPDSAQIFSGPEPRSLISRKWHLSIISTLPPPLLPF